MLNNPELIRQVMLIMSMLLSVLLVNFYSFNWMHNIVPLIFLATILFEV
jgi:hypothetical protein